MGRSLNEVIASLPTGRQAKINARSQVLIAEEQTLQDLRRVMKKTQTTVARALKIKQENVSRIENRADLLISTLEEYVRALGGKLRFIAEFPDRPPVVIHGIGARRKEKPLRKNGPRRRAAA